MKKDDERALNKDRIDKGGQNPGGLLRLATRPAVLLGSYFDIPSRYGRKQTLKNIEEVTSKSLIALSIISLVGVIAYVNVVEVPKKVCEAILEIKPSSNRKGIDIEYRQIDGELAKQSRTITSEDFRCKEVIVRAADYLWMPAGPPTRTFGSFKP